MFLVEYMETHLEFANDRFESSDGAHLRAQKWADLAGSLNSLGGAVKDASQWRKYWADQRGNIKKGEVLRRAAAERSGVNGLGRVKEPTEFEKRVLQLMAPEVVAGKDKVVEMLNISKSNLTSSSTFHPVGGSRTGDQSNITTHLEFLEEDAAENTELLFAPLPRSPSPPQPATEAPSQRRKINSSSGSTFESQYLELESKKIKCMEEHNILLREKNKIEKEKHIADLEWRERQYQLELRKLKILESQGIINSKSIVNN